MRYLKKTKSIIIVLCIPGSPIKNLLNYSLQFLHDFYWTRFLNLRKYQNSICYLKTTNPHQEFPHEVVNMNIIYKTVSSLNFFFHLKAAYCEITIDCVMCFSEKKPQRHFIHNLCYMKPFKCLPL